MINFTGTLIRKPWISVVSYCIVSVPGRQAFPSAQRVNSFHWYITSKSDAMFAKL